MTLQATFSEALRADTVSTALVKLSSQAGELATSLALSADGKTLSLLPATPIQAGTKLTVDITSSITDVAGNTVAPPAGAWTWNVPTFVPVAPRLSANPGNTPAYYPSFRLDPEGRPVVAWTEGDETGSSTYVYRYNR